MTPTQIIQSARERYNAVNDTFWSESEMLTYIYFATVEFARHGLMIERTYSTSTVASTREYTKPSNMIAIKRVEYAGTKLTQYDFDDDDAVTSNNNSTTETGTPAYYYEWNESIFLRPIPSAVGTLKIYGYNEPSIPTISSTLEVQTVWHMEVVTFLVYMMAMKDQNFPTANAARVDFENRLNKAKQFKRIRRRQGRMPVVKNEDFYSNTEFGII